jgi:predicted alpha/beta-hydrolase family hydrolase
MPEQAPSAKLISNGLADVTVLVLNSYVVSIKCRPKALREQHLVVLKFCPKKFEING